MTTTKTIEITRELIDEHGASVHNPFECPGFYALRAADLDISSVWYTGIRGYDGEEIATPVAFESWQRDSAFMRVADIEPISFELEVPDAWVSKAVDA